MLVDLGCWAGLFFFLAVMIYWSQNCGVGAMTKKLSDVAMSNVLEGKHVLITGAAGGLGSVLTEQLAGMGAILIVSDRDAENLDELLAGLPESCLVSAIQADLSVPGEAVTLAEKSLAAIGHINILINNAGLAYHALLTEATEARMREVYEINTFSPINLAKALLPSMKARGDGIIINILSCAGFIPTPTTGVYGASKAAFSAMARTLRLETEPDSIRVYNFYPGPIATSLNENAMRENERDGLFACGTVGAAPAEVAERILSSIATKPGDIWLNQVSKWLALTGTIWPKLADRRLAPVRDEVMSYRDGVKPPSKRRWRLWQVESSIACNLNCIMCPWKDEHQLLYKNGDMAPVVWEKLRPYLPETASVDFTGGGEPLLNSNLAEWIQDAKAAGCKTGFLTNGLILNSEKSQEYIDAGLDWIGFSVDGATSEVYQRIRKGSDFKKLCRNIKDVASMKSGDTPHIMINFVMMSKNIDQLDGLVHLASELGVDQINFKQCDVIRGDHGSNYGLFASKETRKIRRYKKQLDRARRLARKMKIETTAFSFVPDELPVCAQDPRDSLFIRQNGQVSPCINLAIGGETTFLNENVNLPNVYYGHLSSSSLMEIWESEICQMFRTRFEKRDRIYHRVLGRAEFEASLIKLDETLSKARKAMPTPPEGCSLCHYLYDI